MLELMTRIAVTLGVLAVYRLGTHVPLAGIDQTALANLLAGIDQAALANLGSAFTVERVSIFALGVTPIISALLVVEMVRLASERFNEWASVTQNARRVDHYVLIGSLLLAALQGYGIATELERAKNVVDEPGPQFQVNVVATFVASTALLIWLAALISRRGVGSGVWILLLAPYLTGLPGLALSVNEFVHSGVMSEVGLVAGLAYVLVALANRRRAGPHAGQIGNAARPYAHLKLGQLMADDGRWNGKRVLPRWMGGGVDKTAHQYAH